MATITELLDTLNQTIVELDQSYKDLEATLTAKVDQAIADLTAKIEESTLTNDDVIEIVNGILPNASVAEAKNAILFNNLDLEALKKYILPNDDIVDFKLIEKGKVIRYATDEIDSTAINDGYELFCPHSREEYDLARKYLLALGKPTAMGPLGIYYDGNDIPGKYCTNCWHAGHALNSDDMGKLGWKVKDGSLKWWASDRTDITEPNGDEEKVA